VLLSDTINAALLGDNDNADMPIEDDIVESSSSSMLM
jgi:hypothetical protein